MAASPSFSGSDDSAMPVLRTVRVRTGVAPSPTRARMSGRSSSANMPRISRGTPGIIATHRPRSSSRKTPGALPCLLARTRAPRGIITCCRLTSGGSARRLVSHSSRRCSHCSASKTRSRPNRAAIAGLVRSSEVGPRPPVVMTAPPRSRASRTAPAMSAARSATDVRRPIDTPMAASSRASQAPLVSMVRPSSSSSPIVTISTCMGFGMRDRWRGYSR